MTVLVTGGTGYIGSHQVAALVEAGERVVVIDDGSNSDVEHVLDHLSLLLGSRPTCESFDLTDTSRLARVIEDHDVQEVIHFAAMKDLRESVEIPLVYYRNNLGALTSVVEACDAASVRRLVFSSSGSVYGNAQQLPIPEDAPRRPTNPYSATKSIGEQMLADVCEADSRWSVLALRYFNPAGAHPSALIGEAPTRRRSNLMLTLLDVATCGLDAVDIMGDDFDTPDGTGVRDYVHVLDVVDAHIAGLRHLRRHTGFDAVNIGRGVGVSVRDLIAAVESVSGRTIPFRVRDRRPGDVAALVGSTERASLLFDLPDPRNLETIVADAWRWHLETSAASSCWMHERNGCLAAN